MSDKPLSLFRMSDAFRAAVEAVGLVGSVTIHQDGSATRFWVGKPGGHDKEITIRISDYPDKPDVRDS